MSTKLAGLDVKKLGRKGLEDFQSEWEAVETVDEAERLIRAVPHLPVLTEPTPSGWGQQLMRINCLLPILEVGPEADDNAERLQSQTAIVLSKLLASDETKRIFPCCLLPPTIYQLIEIYLKWYPTLRREIWICLDAIGTILESILKKVLFAMYAEQYPGESIIVPGEYVQLQRPAYRRLLRFAILAERFEPIVEHPLPETVARVTAYAKYATDKVIGKRELDTPEQRTEALALLNIKRYSGHCTSDFWKAIKLVRLLHQITLISEAEQRYFRSVNS
ncbi:MAG: hypothetical protein WC451_00830 [Patescibacteria group bacterium]